MSHAELPHVPSPYEGQRLTVKNHLSISAFWFGSNVLWTAFLAVMLPPHMERIGGARASELQGTLIGIGAVFALLVPLLVGPMSDRCTAPLGRRRPYLVVGNAICLLGLALIFLGFQQTSFLGYLGGFLFIQLGNNIATGAYSGLIPDLVPEGQRGQASGFMALMTQLGSAVGAVGAMILMGAGRTLECLIFIGISLTATAGMTVLGIRETQLETKVAFHPIAYLKSLWINPKQHPDFFWVWITRALVMLGFYVVQPSLQFYLRDVIRVKNPPAAAGQTILIVLIAATVTGLWGGHVSDKVGRKRIVYLANSIMAITAFAFPFATNMEAATAVAVVFGLGYGAYISVDWALGTDVLPDKKHAAKDMAVWHVSMTLPQSISAPLAGFLLAAFGSWTSTNDKAEIVHHYYRQGYIAIFFMAAVFLALGAVLLRNVRGAR